MKKKKGNKFLVGLLDDLAFCAVVLGCACAFFGVNEFFAIKIGAPMCFIAAFVFVVIKQIIK